MRTPIPARDLAPDDLQAKRTRDRESQARLRARLRTSNAGRKPKATPRGIRWRGDKSGPCPACFSSGCEGFRGDLTDTYDRADCTACGGTGHLAAGE